MELIGHSTGFALMDPIEAVDRCGKELLMAITGSPLEKGLI